MAEVKEVKTYQLKGVEVFSIGEWNGDTYTINDLNDMVQAFTQTKGGWRPYLKLGHDPKQAIGKKVTAESGAPAIGWIDNLYVRGTKLLADFDYVPEKVYNMIQARAYRKVSCEIYWNLEFGGTKYPRLLTAVALLGAEQPGVMNLDDILGSYAFPDHADTELFAFIKKQDTFREYSHKFELETQEDTSMADDNKAVELEKQLEAQKKEYATAQAAAVEEKKALEGEVVELKKFKEEAEAARVKAEIEAKDAKLAKYVTELESKKLLTKATKPLVEQLLSDKKEYTVEGKAASKEELLEKVLVLTAQAGKVNFDESSLAQFAKKDKGSKDDDMDKEIQAYAKANNCSYSAAYKAVMKKNAKKSDNDADDN